MFTRIKSAFTRRSDHTEDWSALRDAGYRDVPRHFDRSHARERAERDRLCFHPMGHLR